LEQERLEEQDRKDERRSQIIDGTNPSGGRHDLVDDIERVTKYPLALLGIAWLVIAIVVLTKRPEPIKRPRPQADITTCRLERNKK
jgi:hypothetical protein